MSIAVTAIFNPKEPSGDSRRAALERWAHEMALLIKEGNQPRGVFLVRGTKLVYCLTGSEQWHKLLRNKAVICVGVYSWVDPAAEPDLGPRGKLLERLKLDLDEALREFHNG